MQAVHVDGTFYCCREALKIMNPQMAGSIINMGSIMGTYRQARRQHVLLDGQGGNPRLHPRARA